MMRRLWQGTQVRCSSFWPFSIVAWSAADAPRTAVNNSSALRIRLLQGDTHAVDAVPQVPRGVPGRQDGLYTARRVGGARHDGVVSGILGSPIEREETPCERQFLRRKLRRLPAGSAIRRDFDPLDGVF